MLAGKSGISYTLLRLRKQKVSSCVNEVSRSDGAHVLERILETEELFRSTKATRKNVALCVWSWIGENTATRVTESSKSPYLANRESDLHEVKCCCKLISRSITYTKTSPGRCGAVRLSSTVSRSFKSHKWRQSAKTGRHKNELRPTTRFCKKVQSRLLFVCCAMKFEPLQVFPGGHFKHALQLALHSFGLELLLAEMLEVFLTFTPLQRIQTSTRR